MANILRTIQFKRNHNAAVSASEAKQRITNMANDIANGELVLGSYSDSKAVNGISVIAAFKANDKIFFIDNQTILEKLGINQDGTEDANAAEDSFIKQIIEIKENISGSDETIDAIINAVGLNEDGSYTADVNDKFLSGTTSMKDADSKLSSEIKTIEDFIGMSEDASGKSIVEKIDELSATTEALSGAIDTEIANREAADTVLSGAIDTEIANREAADDEIKDTIDELSGKTLDSIDALSGAIDTEIANREAADTVLSGAIDTEIADREAADTVLSGAIDTLSAKTVTSVEDTNSIDLTVEDASDGTKKIKADVKRSAENGNIILEKEDGIYANVDYNGATNALVINGVEKPLNAGSIIDSIEYSGETESLVIKYHDTSGGTHETVAPLGDLVEEYTYPAKDDAHNVGFTITRNVSGATIVQADVNVIDCGEY